eukprot:c15000_g1_i1.p1 GENE.c15000_g1_i1~~c15000_g1_i1.p1  ORF type:complete len:498 (+),score=157.40 c15000_g1_i1:34-1527(+)
MPKKKIPFLCYQNILLILLIFCFVNSTIIRVFNDSSKLNEIKTYSIPSPPLALGNLNFPVSGEVLFGKGCSAISQIEKNEKYSDILSSNKTNIIVLLDYENTNDVSCFDIWHVFHCQKNEWCKGVLVSTPFFNPAGFGMWSAFDKTRPRSDFLVPLVQVSKEDFFWIQDIIADVENNNQTFSLTLTHDESEWEAMFTSPVYLVFLRILTPIWSFGCFLLASTILKQRLKVVPTPRRMVVPYGKWYHRLRSKLKLNLKRICLSLHVFTHFSRIIYYSIDPFFSYQIIPFLPSYLLISFCVAFEIATTILLSFVIRELIHASQLIDVMSKVGYAYCFIAFFLVLNFTIDTTAGLQLAIAGPGFIVKAGFHIAINIVLGFWYFYQGYQFLKKCSFSEQIQQQSTNPAKLFLIRLSTLNGFGLTLFGLTTILALLRAVFGCPWGFFSSWFIMTCLTQIISFCEILLFGGVTFDVAKAKMFVSKIFNANYYHQSNQTADVTT